MCKIGQALRVFKVHKSEPLTAYRCWLERLEPVWACAPNWKVGKTNKSDAPPKTDNSFGLYCNKLENEARIRAIQYGYPVYGEIQIWGTVIEHENGYRASRARIVKILKGKKHLKKKDRKRLKKAAL